MIIYKPWCKAKITGQFWLFTVPAVCYSFISEVTNCSISRYSCHNNCCILSFTSRPGEGRGSPGLLGPRSGHPLLQWVPEGVLPASLNPPLSLLWPGRVWRLLSGATRRAIPRLGPPSEGLQQLQPETRGALAGWGARMKGERVKPSSMKTGIDNIWTERLQFPVVFLWWRFLAATRLSVADWTLFIVFNTVLMSLQSLDAISL